MLIGIGSIWPPTSAKGDVEIPVVKELNTIPNAVPTTKSALQALAKEAAIKHGLNVSRFLATQSCEIKKLQVGTTTVWDYKAQSDHYRGGVRENSWGAWQINLDAHPGVTREQAQDPYWATEWSAQQFEKGDAWKWTCWPGNYT